MEEVDEAGAGARCRRFIDVVDWTRMKKMEHRIRKGRIRAIRYGKVKEQEKLFTVGEKVGERRRKVTKDKRRKKKEGERKYVYIPGYALH